MVLNSIDVSSCTSQWYLLFTPSSPKFGRKGTRICYLKICPFGIWIYFELKATKNWGRKSSLPSPKNIHFPFVKKISICCEISLSGRELFLETTFITWETSVHTIFCDSYLGYISFFPLPITCLHSPEPQAPFSFVSPRWYINKPQSSIWLPPWATCFLVKFCAYLHNEGCIFSC